MSKTATSNIPFPPPVPPKPTKATKAPKSTPPVIKFYLVVYNALSALGWAYILGLLVVHLFNLDGKSQIAQNPLVKQRLSWLTGFLSSGRNAESSSDFLQTKVHPALQPIVARAATSFSRIGEQTKIVQSFALLEVVHALLGWVRSPVVTTVLQVSSRLFLVWGVTQQFPETHSNPIYASMVLAWSITEVIRYTFYALNLVGSNSKVLLWLRYTTFYILYPIGAGSEAFINLYTLPRTVLPACFHSLPAKPLLEWSVAQYARGILFLIWWPGLYVMYTYMISQRRKVFGKPKSKTQ